MKDKILVKDVMLTEKEWGYISEELIKRYNPISIKIFPYSGETRDIYIALRIDYDGMEVVLTMNYYKYFGLYNGDFPLNTFSKIKKILKIFEEEIYFLDQFIRDYDYEEELEFLPMVETDFIENSILWNYQDIHGHQPYHQKGIEEFISKSLKENRLETYKELHDFVIENYPKSCPFMLPENQW